MNTLSMNSKNGKTSHPHRRLLNLTDKINLKRSDKYVALSNLSIYYTCNNIKESYKGNKFKKQLQHGMKNLKQLVISLAVKLLIKLQVSIPKLQNNSVTNEEGILRKRYIYIKKKGRKLLMI